MRHSFHLPRLKDTRYQSSRPCLAMESYIGMDNFWDMNHNPSSFSTIGEDDFLALLQKQFPTNGNPFDIPPPDGIDPLNLNNLPVQNPTPPSTDSSPSPPSTNQEPAMSRRHSGAFSSTSPTATESPADDPMLKRKASDEQMSDEPTMKTAHTGAFMLQPDATRPCRHLLFARS